MLEMLLLVVKSPPFIVILVAETRVGPAGSVGAGQEAMKAKKERARKKRKNSFAVISVFLGVKPILLLFLLMLFFIDFLLKFKFIKVSPMLSF